MKLQTKQAFFSILLLIILPCSAQAHSDATLLHGFTEGFMHPWLGIDHMLVMSAIGLWAVWLGKRALWVLPGSFLVAMAVGALLNFSGLVLNGMELWVAFSLLLVGVLLYSHSAMPLALAAGLVIAFALGHGYVHAAEIGNDTHTLLYTLGFLMSTATLHGLGMLAGLTGATALTIMRSGCGLFCAVTGMLLLSSV